MKPFISLFILSFLLGSLFAQDLHLDNDHCTHCNMVIRDQQFAAIAESRDRETLKFDAIECLINYLKTHEEENFEKLLVADYSRPGKWVRASEATYLKSNEIPSPMGAYLSAYPDKATAAKIQKQKSGEIYNWKEIKLKFKDSNFGLLNHPDHHHHRSDAYASIGIMGDHVHHKGGVMMSFRYMNMQMRDNQSGTTAINNSEIYTMYMAVPQRMQMDMYMLGIMYAPTDKLTLALMQSLINREMQMEMQMMGMGNGMGMNTRAFKTKSSGLGDLKLSALYSLWANEKASFHLNGGISFPHGNISKSYDTPMSDDMKLPYAMQLGSGTVDFTLGGTFKQSFNKSSLGVQPVATIRSGKNSQGYRLGNRYQVNGWYAFGATTWLGLIVRAEYIAQQEVTGSDDELNPMMTPLANTSNSGYEQINAYAGANLSFPGADFLKSVRLGIEMGIPVYRKVTGVQMKEFTILNAGLRYLL